MGQQRGPPPAPGTASRRSVSCALVVDSWSSSEVSDEENKLAEPLPQERVLTLLYDKTFPPRSQSQSVGLQGVRDLVTSQKRRISKSAKGLYPKSQLGKESMRTFNYYGQTRLESLDENDVDGLKREIDFIVS